MKKTFEQNKSWLQTVAQNLWKTQILFHIAVHCATKLSADMECNLPRFARGRHDRRVRFLWLWAGQFSKQESIWGRAPLDIQKHQFTWNCRNFQWWNKSLTNHCAKWLSVPYGIQPVNFCMKNSPISSPWVQRVVEFKCDMFRKLLYPFSTNSTRHCCKLSKDTCYGKVRRHPSQPTVNLNVHLNPKKKQKMSTTALSEEPLAQQKSFPALSTLIPSLKSMNNEKRARCSNIALFFPTSLCGLLFFA